MSALHGRPVRRVVLSTGATVAGVVVLLSLKPHTTGGSTAAVAPAAPAPSSTATAGTGSSGSGSHGAGTAGASGSGPSGSTAGSTAGGTGSGGKSGTAASGGTSGGTSGGNKSGGTSGASTATRTVDGDTVQTRYGPVQLRITVTGGRITKVTALQLPSDNPRDQEIAGFSVPQLTQEALAAQSAHIDAVSGASYTSQGYIQSLQSAIDRAGL